MGTGRASSIVFARWQLIAMAGVILGFVASTTAAAVRMNGIDTSLDLIVGNAMPSVQELTAARGDLHGLDTYLDRYVRAAASGDRIPSDPLRAYRHGIETSLDSYVALPFFPNERSLFGEVADSMAAVDRTLADALSAVDAEDRGREESALAEAHRESDRADKAIERLVNFDAREGERLGAQAALARRSATWLMFSLDGVVGTFAAAATVLAAIALRRAMASLETTRRQAEGRASILQERSSELEQFAGRVAHDILSPLMAVAIGLRLSKERLADDAAAVAMIDRSAGSLMRVQRIVAGLLDFARAGAHPDPHASSDLAACVQGVVDDTLSEADAARVRLIVKPFANRRLACSTGVLASLLANLVRNAIKYMGDSALRQVEIRAEDTEAFVRVAVEDTGPGIPTEIQRSIFEPFFRAAAGAVPGAGLGLTTVRKLAQAHGGCVGCRSEPGSGSTFWFELPRAREPHPGATAVEIAYAASELH